MTYSPPHKSHLSVSRIMDTAGYVKMEESPATPVSAPYPYPSPGFVSRRKKRAGNWSPEETLVLIQLWRGHLYDLRSAKRNSHVYHSMAEKMAKLGFLRLPAEVRNKILNLTADYRKEKMKMEATNSPTTWKFWNEVKEVMESLSMQEIQAMKGYRSSLDYQGDDQNMTGSPSGSMISEASSSGQSYGNNGEQHPGDLLVTSLKEGGASSVDGTPDGSPSGYNKSVNNSHPVPAKDSAYRNEYLQIVKVLIEEQRRSNHVAEEAERQTLELMRQQLYLKQQSLMLQNRIVTILERFANGDGSHVENDDDDIQEANGSDYDDDDGMQKSPVNHNSNQGNNYSQCKENGQTYDDQSSNESSHLNIVMNQ